MPGKVQLWTEEKEFNSTTIPTLKYEKEDPITIVTLGTDSYID